MAGSRSGKRWQKKYFQRYNRGKPEDDVREIGTSDTTGTKTTFKPDAKIFETLDFDYEILSNRLRELAFLNRGLTISLKDLRTPEGQPETFTYEGGIVEFVKYLNNKKQPLHDPIYFERQRDDMVVEIAMQYTGSYTENVHSFANNINTHEGGTHIIGFKTALTRVANDYIKANKLSKEDIKLTGDDVREGLTAIISVKLMEPQFEGQTKTRLGNSDVKGIVDSLVTDGLAEYFEENPKVANVILEKALLAQKAREAAKKSKRTDPEKKCSRSKHSSRKTCGLLGKESCSLRDLHRGR